ncbi:MAG: hypothetical protein KQ78_02123 [Candidatus Izimaplasma bacterium HR2]|nr:MAG: hypothetical protein KQ78_02123 [Candidatus Izimaplasma bacterium HR2]
MKSKNKSWKSRLKARDLDEKHKEDMKLYKWVGVAGFFVWCFLAYVIVYVI